MSTRCIQRKHLLSLSAVLAVAIWPSVTQAQAPAEAQASVITWTANGASDAQGTFFLATTQYPTVAAWDAGAASAGVSPGAFSPTGLTFISGINLSNTDLIVNADTSTDALAAYSLLYQAAKAGYNGGAWTGNSNSGNPPPGPTGGIGLFSDATQTNNPNGISATTDPDYITGIGVVLNDLNGNDVYGNDTGYSTWDNDAVGVNSVLVKYTYYGDTELRGTVDETDFFNAVAGRDGDATGWANGETEYNGVVNQTDVFDVETSRDSLNPTDTDPIVSPSDGQVALAGAVVGVPEPSSVALVLMLGGVCAAIALYRRFPTNCNVSA